MDLFIETMNRDEVKRTRPGVETTSWLLNVDKMKEMIANYWSSQVEHHQQYGRCYSPT